MNNIKIIEQDIIFLSYDEPNAEKNYADLCSKAPWAKRVHGVKGSDAAHKACSALSDTEYFVTVDADNIVDADFFKVEIDLNELGLTSENVFSWCGSVHVNGLRYGNGGLKLWTRAFVNEMRTHENSDPADVKSVVEFCFDSRYYQFNDCYSESYTNASPFQAWRAGFREGVKMSLDQGAKTVDIKSVWWQNYHRLLIWSSVGADVSNGTWSMLGSQEGAYLTNCTEWDYANVRDFDYLTDYWKTTHATASAADTSAYLNLLGEKLQTSCKLEISNLDAAGSAFFKTVYNNTPRIVRKR
jgi:hypothetical protein